MGGGVQLEKRSIKENLTSTSRVNKLHSCRLILKVAHRDLCRGLKAGFYLIRSGRVSERMHTGACANSTSSFAANVQPFVE